MHTVDIRKRFLQHYRKENHQLLLSGSLLDPATPMTFVGSAGLTQIETGVEHDEDHSGERYVLVQPCFRHFDIEKVGNSPVHLSLFEMGGAFAFGHVARQETLGKIWRFLTENLGLDSERLWVTNFAGGELDGHQLQPDALTFEAWQALSVVPAQIIDVDVEAGFWKQGDGLTGLERFRKCGPTTEVYFDRGEELRCDKDCQPGCGCGRFIEIANILFIHYCIDQTTNALFPLSTPFDETVIGVERLAMAVQGHSSVFALEYFAPSVQFVATYPHLPNSLPEATTHTQCCVIADHIRALLFLAADGAPPPGKGGRARIMRLLIRDILMSERVLGIEGADFVSELIDVTLQLYKNTFPHLASAHSKLLSYFGLERKRFERTLRTGYRQLNRFIRQDVNGRLSGTQTLTLVKKYGFPLPLIKAELDTEGIPFDQLGYNEAHRRWLQTINA